MIKAGCCRTCADAHAELEDYVPGSSDCIPCHFAAEERAALRFSTALHRWLVEEHRKIQEAGYPPEAILAHAREEAVIFRRLLPPKVAEVFFDDHDRMDPILEQLVDDGVASTPTGRLTPKRPLKTGRRRAWIAGGIAGAGVVGVLVWSAIRGSDDANTA